MSSSDESTPKAFKGKGSDDTVPVAELMRRKNLKNESSTNSDLERNGSKDDAVDIDDEIKRLEAELAESSSSEDSDDSDDINYDSCDLSNDDGRKVGKGNEEFRRKRIKFGEATILNPEESHDESTFVTKGSGSGIISISECASDSIAPLPNSALPKTVSKPMKCDLPEGAKANRKRKRSISGNDVDDSQASSDGLREAVKEVLAGYVARSSEKIPFYCRVCSVQCKDEDDFFAHKQSEFHKTAVQVEKKATYCRLCRKQLTSIVQMHEHLDSRPHKEKLDKVQARQRGGTGYRPGRGFNGVQGRGGRGRGDSGRGYQGPGHCRGDKRSGFSSRGGRGPGGGHGRGDGRFGSSTRGSSRRQWS